MSKRYHVFAVDYFGHGESTHDPALYSCATNGDDAVRIQGMLDFSLIGILSKSSSILAENRIGIFAVSTYNTNYILVKKDDFKLALEALESNGYSIA